MALTAALVGSRGTTSGNSVTTGSGTSASTATFACLVSYDATAGTITAAGDNKGNTYTAVGTAQADGAGGLLRWYVCENGTGGSSHTFTFTTSSNSYAVAHLIQITSDAGGIPRLDLNVQGQDTVGQPWDTVATGTLNYANEVILGAVGSNSNGGSSADYASSNMTVLSSEGNCSSFWTSGVAALNQAGTSSFTPSFTKSDAGGSTGCGLSHITLREEASSGSAITAAAGVSTTSTLTGSSTAAATITAASGAATTGTLAGSGSAPFDAPWGVFDPELVPQAWFDPGQVQLGWFDERLIDEVQGGDSAAISPAAGVSTTATLVGSSTAATVPGAAAGVSTAATMAGIAVTAATAAAAAGVSTTSTLAGAAVTVAHFAPPPVVGVHTLLGIEDGSGSDPETTSPINTQASGSSLVTFTAGYSNNTGGPTDSEGNTWTAAGSEVYTGYSGQFDVRGYYVEQAVGDTGHTVTFQADGTPAGEMTIPFVEIRNAGRLRAYAKNYPAAGSALTSGDVTTLGPAVLVAFWWGDATGLTHTASPNNSFTNIESFGNLPPNSAVQCFVAAREVTAPGTYNVTWTESPDQGAPLWLFAFENVESGAHGVATTSTLAGAAIKAATISAAAGAATTGTVAGSSVAAAAITSAAGSATASAAAGASTAAAALTAADGVATTGTLAGSGGTGSTIAAAAGVSTTAALSGSSVAASAIAAADGVATTSAAAGTSTAAAALTAADGVATTGTLAGSGGTGSTIAAAAGVSTTATLAGRSTNAATPTAADGIATTATAAGSSVASAAFAPAAGASTAGALAGAGVTAASITAASGAATTSSLAGGGIFASALAAAAGSSVTGSLSTTVSAVSDIVAAAGASITGTLLPFFLNAAGSPRRIGTSPASASTRVGEPVADLARLRIGSSTARRSAPRIG